MPRSSQRIDCNSKIVFRTGPGATALLILTGGQKMNIKSLLLGSAAALVAVSGARAADAIVIAEPEPVEYVRICDAYGAGFFYIPGTETCLRFDGYVRYQVNAAGGDRYIAATEDSVGIVGATPVVVGAPGVIPGEPARIADAVDGWSSNVRARLNVDARSDTEWGLLRAFMRLQANTNGVNADANYQADQAMLQLGGFYAGYTESAWAAPYGLPGISRFGIFHTDNGGEYAYQQRQQIGYFFTGGNGFFGSITLEDDEAAGEGYIPDVVGVIGVSQGWGGVWVKGAFDESADEFNAMIGMQYNIPNMAGSSLRAGAFYASDVNAYALSMPFVGDAEWSIAASYNHAFNAQWSATIGAQYFDGFNLFGVDTTGYRIEAAAVWVPVTNFEVRLEGAYVSQDDIVLNDGDAPIGADAYSGFLRFTRYF
jgi:hypothetical protein